MSAAPVASAAPIAPPTDAFHDLLLTEKDCTTPTSKTVSRADALADVEVVRRVLERGWAGYDARATRADFTKAFDALRAAVSALPEPVDTALLEDAMVEHLRVALDDHLAFFLFDAAGWSRYRPLGRTDVAYTVELVVDATKPDVVSGDAPKNAKLERCGDLALADLLMPSVTDDLKPIRRPIVISPKPPAPLTCAFSVPGKPAEARALAWRRLHVDGPAEPLDEPYQEKAGAIPTERVRSFNAAHETLLETFVASAEKARDGKAVVLDLRGNTGGSEDFVDRYFQNLTSLELSLATTDELTSEVSLQGAVNAATCQLAYGVPDQGDRLELQGRAMRARFALDGLDAQNDLARRYQHQGPKQAGKAPKPFVAPLVVLTDKLCASACEAFVLRAHQLPGALHVGENTRGVGEMTDVRTYRLPRSGLGLAAGAKRLRDPTSRQSEEGRGYLPDLWLDTKDAPKVAAALADCMAKKTCAVRDFLKAKSSSGCSGCASR